jgi:hypothetical protein
MNDETPAGPVGGSLDELLRESLPELKLALGALIDRENARALPGRYARLLPETLLAVTLRPDAADALAPVAASVEAELTDSCMRHGSLYDRAYRVQLRRVDDSGAPLFAVSAHAGQAASPVASPGAGPATNEPVSSPAAPPTAATADPAPAVLPAVDPDATRLDGFAPPGWESGRWLLVVSDVQGEAVEAFRLSEPLTTVGRRSDDPGLQTTVSLSDVPHVSRRQLAFVWEERGGRPGFRVYNLGQPPAFVGDVEVPGARVGRGALRLDTVPDAHTAWLGVGERLRIGEQGPVLHLDEVPPDEDEPADPDATRFD